MSTSIVQGLQEKLLEIWDFSLSENAIVKVAIILILFSFSGEVNTNRFSFRYDPIVGRAILALSAFAPGNSGIKFIFWHQENNHMQSKEDN